MSSRKVKYDEPRDTAKDILLGLDPSGAPPRRPKEGRAVGAVRPRRPTAPVSPMPMRDPLIESRLSGAERTNQGLLSELQRLQNQFRNYQQQQDQALESEKTARRRLEQQLVMSDDTMQKMASKGDGGANQQVRRGEIEDFKRLIANLEAKVLHMNQDVQSLKSVIDRHTQDLMQLNNEVKNRPATDVTTKSSNVQQLDGRMRDLHGEMMNVRQMLDTEVNERRRVDQGQAENISRLQDYIQRQDASKNEILTNLARQGDLGNQKMSEEAKRLNDKIQLITDEVMRNMADKEQRLRDENQQKYLVLEKAIKTELEARLLYEKDVRAFLDERWNSYRNELDELKNVQQAERQKFKERFQKVGETLAFLEQHLQQGNKKMDKIMSAEIQSRKLHEKGLLTKLSDIEDKLAAYLSGLNKAIEETREGQSVKAPSLDTSALRREMEAIAADKHKLSMEGLLKIEDKMQRIESGLNRDKRELEGKVGVMASSTAASDLKKQLSKLDQLQEDLEKSHEQIRDKVERQIPQDLNELSQKLDNFKKQLHDRIDKEEEERFLAIKELQEAINKIKNRPVQVAAGAAPTTEPTSSQVQRDVDECKIAIKKLAESVTTVKNVLDRKLNEEIRNREKAAARIENIVDAFKSKKSS